MNKLLLNLVLVPLLLSSQWVFAGAIICDAAGDPRRVELSNIIGSTPSCGATSKTEGYSNQPGKYFGDYLGYDLLDKAEDGATSGNTGWIESVIGIGTTEGSIQLKGDLQDTVLVFKFGAPQINPDWISFVLADMTQADWKVLQTQSPGNSDAQALSHVSLWGKIIAEVPEPGTALLLATGIFGLVASRKQMKKSA